MGKFGGYKIWRICPEKLLAVFKFGRFVRKHSVLGLLAVVSGTGKCLIALLGLPDTSEELFEAEAF